MIKLQFLQLISTLQFGGGAQLPINYGIDREQTDSLSVNGTNSQVTFIILNIRILLLQEFCLGISFLICTCPLSSISSRHQQKGELNNELWPWILVELQVLVPFPDKFKFLRTHQENNLWFVRFALDSNAACIKYLMTSSSFDSPENYRERINKICRRKIYYKLYKSWNHSTSAKKFEIKLLYLQILCLLFSCKSI